MFQNVKEITDEHELTRYTIYIGSVGRSLLVLGSEYDQALEHCLATGLTLNECNDILLK